MWKTSVGDKCKLMRPKATKSGRQEWQTSVGDKCKLMRPKAPRVGDTCGRQVEDKCGRLSVGDKCHPLMQPKATRVGDKCQEDKCGRQV